MTNYTQILIFAATFFIGLGFCAALTPSVAAFAYRLGALDAPLDERRMHKKITPRIGGIGVLCAAALAGAAMGGGRDAAAVFAGGLILAAVGVTDDTFTLSPLSKLIGQIVSAAIPAALGIYPRAITAFGFEAELPSFLGAPLFVLWAVILINAVNFIDGLDGLASGFGAISHLALSLMSGDGAVFPLAVSGACTGFLAFNRTPAQIFLGDTGAMFIGYAFAAITAVGGIPLECALLAAAYPLTDLTQSVLRRISAGVSPFRADRGHFHHRLVDGGRTASVSVGILLALASVSCAAAVAIYYAWYMG